MFFLRALCQIVLFCVVMFFYVSGQGLAHGFNANRVYKEKMESGVTRITIMYTHVELGEYRQAYIIVNSDKEAEEIFSKLVKGADFFLGDVKKSIHFHDKPAVMEPF